MGLKQDRPRPDWHMRWPFVVAYLAVVAIFFALDWRAGLLLLALLPLQYLGHTFLRWLQRLQWGGTRND
jgi:hypothetical protein